MNSVASGLKEDVVVVVQTETESGYSCSVPILLPAGQFFKSVLPRYRELVQNPRSGGDRSQSEHDALYGGADIAYALMVKVSLRRLSVPNDPPYRHELRSVHSSPGRNSTRISCS